MNRPSLNALLGFGEEIIPDYGWREVVVDPKTGQAHQAGSTHPDGRFINELRTHFEQNLYAFSVGVMGRNYLTPFLHLPLCESLQKTPPFRKMRLFPRDHAKTSVVGHCLPPHILIQPKLGNLYFPGIDGCENRILLSGESATRAESNLRVIRTAFESNKIMRALWPSRVWEAPRRQAKKWNDQQIIIPRSQDYPDPSVYAIGVGGAITGSRPTVIIKDDLISLEAANSEVVMRAAIEWHKASRALMDEFSKDTGLESLEFIIGCLTADAEVTLEDGTRRSIKSITVGDRVWSADVWGRLYTQEVEAVIPQGFAETYTLQTTSHTLRATGNHPMLVSFGKNELTWKRLDEVVVGDCVVSHKELPGHKDDEEAEFCWFFGFMLGDGWAYVKDNRGCVCFAAGIDETLNRRAIAAMRRYLGCGKIYLTKGRYYRADCKPAAQRLLNSGLVGRAKTKRVPLWVYWLSPEKRRAFLQGFCDADGGWQSHKIWNVEISNRRLLKDLRHLADLCGVRHGRLTGRERLIQPPHSKYPIRSVCWRTSFNFSTIDRIECHGSSNLYGGQNIGRDTHLDLGLRFERVVSVKRNRVAEEVFDLTVKGTPSFFANGLAVHNTRWAVFDLYEYVLSGDEDTPPDHSVDVEVRSIVENDEDGNPKPIWPERFPLERVDQLRREFGSMFYLLYMNRAHDPNLVDFDLTEVRSFDLKGDYILFESDERDESLAKAEASVPPPRIVEPRRMPANAETFDYLFGEGRARYLRMKYA